MYPCLACGDLTPFLWEQVVGRERGETPAVACICLRCCSWGRCSTRKMLEEGRNG